MGKIARTYWPLVIPVLLFIAVSGVVNANLETLQPLLADANAWYGMVLYVLIGMVCVWVPFGSLVPFMPLAVSAWGWQTTALLNVIAWTAGSQLLFELARALGKPFVYRMIPKERRAGIQSFMKHQGFFEALALRMFVHGDLVSYAFGIFTNVNRWTYLVLTAIAATPSAIATAYFGKLPLQYQIITVTLGLTVLISLYHYRKTHPEAMEKLKGLGGRVKSALLPQRETA